MSYRPTQVYIEEEARSYPIGERAERVCNKLSIPVVTVPSTKHLPRLTGGPAKQYMAAKRTMVVALRRNLKFASCKPSANFQLPLATSCPGLCAYCYLQTTLGPRPYVKIYANLEDILRKATSHIEDRLPEVTTFEGAATSDPLPVEEFSHALRTTIEFFGTQAQSRFRFVTKFANVDNLLSAKHGGHTEVRFSVNTATIIDAYEKGTASAEQRILAAQKIATAGYPLGFLIAPIILYDNWQDEYASLIAQLAANLPRSQTPTFELITHRFTKRAKDNILKVFPDTDLPLEEGERRFKFGQFGYGKYVYQPNDMEQIDEFFRKHLSAHFPQAEIVYLV